MLLVDRPNLLSVLGVGLSKTVEDLDSEEALELAIGEKSL
jgi:hypothetical protein